MPQGSRRREPAPGSYPSNSMCMTGQACTFTYTQTHTMHLLYTYTNKIIKLKLECLYTHSENITKTKKLAYRLLYMGFYFSIRETCNYVELNTKRIVINNTIYTKILQKVDLRFSNNLELLQIPW